MYISQKIFMITVGALCSAHVIGQSASQGSYPLFLKPAFELTEKDQVLLDILHQDALNVHRDALVIEEVNGRYPETVEKSFHYYREVMEDASEPYQERYIQAIQGAANHLASLLSPAHKASSLKVGDCMSLLIGINYEHSASQLSNCINDVEHVLELVLKPRLGAIDDHVIFMSDHKKGTNLYPTCKNIREQIKNFVTQVNQTKLGYFHYSGHGASVKDTSGDEADGYDEAFVPIDYERSGLIIDDDMYTMLVKPLQPDVHLIVVTDCCHSGTILDLPYKWDADGTHSVEHVISQAELNALPNVIMLSGCKDSQTSADGGPITILNEGSGALTGAFLKVLEKHAYRITYRDLLSEVNQYLKDNKFSQRPQLTSTRLLNLDDIYIAPNRAVAVAS
ncbi:MAG: caspase family protein [Chlamydiota bacterium]